jgi:hypothetical protein
MLSGENLNVARSVSRCRISAACLLYLRHLLLKENVVPPLLAMGVVTRKALSGACEISDFL